MHPDLQKYMLKQRKLNRDLLELRVTEQKIKSHKQPDAKMLKHVQDAIANIEKELQQ